MLLFNDKPYFFYLSSFPVADEEIFWFITCFIHLYFQSGSQITKLFNVIYIYKEVKNLLIKVIEFHCIYVSNLRKDAYILIRYPELRLVTFNMFLCHVLLPYIYIYIYINKTHTNTIHQFWSHSNRNPGFTQAKGPPMGASQFGNQTLFGSTLQPQ